MEAAAEGRAAEGAAAEGEQYGGGMWSFSQVKPYITPAAAM